MERFAIAGCASEKNMDNKLVDLVQEMVNLQKQQNDLLARHLTRIKFSLWSLFLLMTFICLGLGAAFVSSSRSGQKRTPPTPMPARPVTPMPSNPYQNYQTPPNPSPFKVG
jgi:hypothetical protein